jgi:hypothetical protein
VSLDDEAGAAMSAELEELRRRVEMVRGLYLTWRTRADRAAHDHEGADYQLGVAAGTRACMDDLKRMLKRDVITGEDP